MALLSSALLVRTHSLTLLAMAYYLLTSPDTLLSSTPVWLLGESMSVRPAAFAAPEPTASHLRVTGTLPGRSLVGADGESLREAFALLAVLVVAYAVMQLVFAADLVLDLPSQPVADRAAGHTEASKTASSRFAEQTHTLLTAQSRWLTLAGLHVMGASLMVFWMYAFHAQRDAWSSPSVAGPRVLDRLATRVTFAMAFADMLFWGYIWTVLKDEGRQVAQILAWRGREALE